MFHNTAGIDPGLEGAVAILDPTGAVVYAARLATVPHGKRPRINADQLFGTLKEHGVIHATVENVSVRPGQGIASSGAFMRATGTAEAAAQIACGPNNVTWVTPQTWKRFHGFAKGSSKETSRLKALELWPEQRVLFTPKRMHLTKKHAQDVAEAALIAHWYFETRGKKVRKLLPARHDGALVGN